MTDNRTNEPTEAQTQRATIEYREHHFRWSDGATRICVCGVTTESLAEFSQHRMRAALVAAQGAAPQAVKDVHEPSHDRVYCVRCGGNWPCQPAPVLPSSGVDEDKLAEVIEKAMRPIVQKDRLGTSAIYPGGKRVARAVAEWLKEQVGE